MEIIEKDGKYYMKLANGELEISKKQAEGMIKERGAVLRNNLKNWIDNFSLRQWPVTHVPNDAESFILSEAFFNEIIKELEQIYRANGSTEQIANEMVSFCIGNMDRLRKSRSGSAFPSFIDYQVVCWLRVQAFVLSLTNSTITLF